VTSEEGERYALSDTERRDALASLVRAASDGQVTLDEFSRRTDVALAARTRTDLVAATADLGMVPAPGSIKRHFIVLFGNRVRRGRFVLPEHTSAVMFAGEIHLVCSLHGGFMSRWTHPRCSVAARSPLTDPLRVRRRQCCEFG
jgi:hypothetical protein